MDLHLTDKGQTTIPKALREHLGVKPGDKITAVILRDGSVYLVPKTPLSSLKGMFKDRVSKPVSIEDMNAAVKEGAEERDRRSRKK